MKAIERNLYLRGGYFYFRSALPKNLWSVFQKREVIIALGLKDRTEAKLCAAQIGYALSKCLDSYDGSSPNLCLPDFKALIASDSRAFTPKPFQASRGSNERFSQISTAYLNDCISDRYKTKDHKKQTFRIFIEIMGDLTFGQIGKNEARLFKATLLKIPSNVKKRLSVKSKDLPAQSSRTINGRLKPLNALFNWAIKNGFYEEENPFAGLNLKEASCSSSRRYPYSEDELKVFFNSPIYTGSKGSRWADRFLKGKEIHQDSLFWVPLIGLYSGMRLNEICQLRLKDIRQQEDVWFFDVTDDGGNTLKNSSSNRRVPIHPVLTARGFLIYVQDQKRQNKTRLFEDIDKGSDGTYSAVFSKRFARTLKILGLKRKGLCFHSYRHTFIDGLRNQGVDSSIAMALSGHSNSQNSVHKNYGLGYNLRTLNDELSKLKFKVVEERP